MNNMRPSRRRNAEWDYKKTDLSDIDNDQDFEIYLLAKPEQLKQYFIEQVPYFWVHHRISKDRQFQKYINELNNEIDVKGFPYVDNMLQAIDSFNGNFKVICQVKDLQRILQYHTNNKKLICIHIFDLELKKATNMIRNKKIQIKSDDFKSFKRTLYRKKFDKNQIDTFTNATRITDWDIAQVNQSRLVLKTLLVSKNDRKGKQDFVKLATIVEQEHGKISEYESIYKVDSTPEQAVRWYTKEGFYHRLVNNALKAGKGNPLFLSYIRFPVKQMYNAIKKLYKSKQLFKESFQCYRGGKISESQLDYFRKNRKGFIEMQGFLSCSKNKAEMTSFIVNCVFKIVVNNLERDPEWDHGFCVLDSKELTEFIKEEEVLFNIFSVMEIKDVARQVFNNQQIDVITLEYGSLASFLYQKRHNLKLKDQKYSEICIKNYQALKPYYDSITNQVDCFRFFGKFKQVEEYYLTQIQFMEKNQIKDKQRYFQAYLHLASNYLNQKEFSKAKQKFLLTKQLSEKNPQSVKSDEITLSKIQNGLGIANKNLQKLVQAKNNYLKTINLIEKSRNRNGKVYLATAYNNLAAILVDEGQDTQALNYYEKALNLLEDQQNQTTANIHYNIGLYNLKKQDFKASIKNFIRSLEIYNKIFGTHKETINCNIRLGEAYLRDGSSKQTYERYFSAALDMMKNLAFSSRDEYFQVTREIQDIKERHRKNVQRVTTQKGNHQVENFFNLINKKDEVDRYLNQETKQRDRFQSDHHVFNYPSKKQSNQISKNAYSERLNTPIESAQSSPQLEKDKHQKLRAIRAQNILGNESAFGLMKNLSSNQFDQKNNQFIIKTPLIEQSPVVRQKTQYHDSIDAKLGSFKLSTNSKAFSMNKFLAANLNENLGNNSGVGALGKYQKADNDSFLHDFYKDLKDGKKKRTLIFG